MKQFTAGQPEFTKDEILRFDKKSFGSVSARMLRAQLLHSEADKKELLEALHKIIDATGSGYYVQASMNIKDIAEAAIKKATE